MNPATNATNRDRKYPFNNMQLADHTVLDTIEGRHDCPLCNRSRKFFCYNCLVPVGNLEQILPKVTLPIDIDIIKHKKEIDGKSTATHAALLARDHVRMYTYPDIPDYDRMDDVVLIFPSATSCTVPQLFGRNVRLKTENNYGRPKGHNFGTLIRQRLEEVTDDGNDNEVPPNNAEESRYNYNNLPIKRAVFIDSTWNQCRGIYKDPRVRRIRSVVLQNRMSQFWRHQRGSPRWYMATIEAIHQFLLEVHVNAWGLEPKYRGLDNLEICSGFYETVQYREASGNEPDERLAPYRGQYDNIMFFFANMYDLIHKYYDHNTLKSYRRPI